MFHLRPLALVLLLGAAPSAWAGIGSQDSTGADMGFVAILKCGANFTTCSRTGNILTLNPPAGGAGTPGGVDTQVQFNDAGAFGGDAGATFNKTTDVLTLAGGLGLGGGAGATFDLTSNLSGATDPVLRFANNAINATTGVLQQAGTPVVLETRQLTVAGTANEITSSAGAQTLAADRTWTLSLPAALNFSGKSLFLPSGITPPAADCDDDAEKGRVFIDTNATSGQQVYVCEGLATGWKLQGDGGAGGGITGLTADAGGTTTGTTITLAGGAGITTTRSVDTITTAFAPTEISSLTWGAGSFTTMTFDAGASDPVLTASSGVLNVSAGELQAAGQPVVTDNTVVTSVDGKGLTITGGTLDADGSIVGGSCTQTLTATFYVPMLGGRCNTNSATQNRQVAPMSGTIKNCYFAVHTAPGAGTSWDPAVTVATVATGCPTATISGTATSNSDTTSSCAITAGQTWGILWTKTGAVADATGAYWSCQFVPS